MKREKMGNVLWMDDYQRGKFQKAKQEWGKKKKPKKKKPKEKPDKIKSFYSSYEWRRVRMVVLKRDGRRCVCCGVTPAEGATMNVDHIKPLRGNWHLRLDEDNLQVLCGVCNHGKGNWDETDWKKTP